MVIVDGILCHEYSPGPLEEFVTVPILPPSFHQEALILSHDIPTAGYQGMDKTLQRLRKYVCLLDQYGQGC